MNHSSELSPSAGQPSRGHAVAITLLTLLTAALAWSYWPALKSMAHKWESDPQYSHGWLVPVFALALLWLRRDRMQSGQFHPGWWGLPLIGLALVLKLVAAYFYFEWLDLVSFVPCVAGICLVVGGRAAMAWAWPAVVFLFFMVPLPYTLEQFMREPLRWIGTKASTYLMQTVGLPAYSEGFVVVVGEQRIGDEEACSGLNMLMTFFALSTAVAVICARPLWERAVIVVSAVPIALIANVARVTIVGILHANGAHEFAQTLHRQAAFLMMPIALGLLWVELRLLSALFIVEHIHPMAVGLDAPAAPDADEQLTEVGGNVPASVRG
ncbi:MAG TPA: exosortase/archaeosortase family protein [Planctomycetaceae bacterium]|nr:exosortase/archaeosortase family protein [Planctomycetaceae bacterium]